MILDLDIGNSLIKWRMSATGQSTPVLAGSSRGLAELKPALPAGSFPQRIRIANVRSDQTPAALAAWSRHEFGIEAEIARVQRCLGGVEVFYQDLSRLGVDRWLSMLAAHQCYGGRLMLVGCGTALTIDLLDLAGRHQGGYIVPGFSLAATALQEHTAIQLGAMPQPLPPGPGHSTETAVYQGIRCMLAGFVRAALAQVEMVDGQLILSGGDRELVREQLRDLPLPITSVETLVLDGLAIALP